MRKFEYFLSELNRGDKKEELRIELLENKEIDGEKICEVIDRLESVEKAEIYAFLTKKLLFKMIGNYEYQLFINLLDKVILDCLNDYLENKNLLNRYSEEHLRNIGILKFGETATTDDINKMFLNDSAESQGAADEKKLIQTEIGKEFIICYNEFRKS